MLIIAVGGLLQSDGQGYRPSFSTSRIGTVGIVLEYSHRLGQDTSSRVPPKKQRKIAEKKR